MHARANSSDAIAPAPQTWGAPYDPHSYLKSWTAPDEAHYAVMNSGTTSFQPTSFAVDVDAILAETNAVARQTKYTSLLTQIHNQVFHLPLWGLRIPSVCRRSRVAGYAPGQQQFDYPIKDAYVVSGSKNVTIAPGAQTGLFSTVGRMDPHTYRPNEFFSNNWIYEGLVAYGTNGAIEPALATSWTSTTDSAGAETIRFTLRTGVTFHDGETFNCAAVKLNFDHVFVEELKGGDWHGWYGLPGALESWSCDGEVFVLVGNAPYYPLLQELSYIRPLRMLSPGAFVNGINTDATRNNSCHVGWNAWLNDIHCSGMLYPSGTGPFKFVERTDDPTDDDGTSDSRVVFGSFADYWNGEPDIDFLHIVKYDSADAVNAALLDESLDCMLGAGVMNADDLDALKYDDDFEVLSTEPVINTVLIMNIDDPTVRKTVIHAVDKPSIVASERGGEDKVVTQLFSENVPYCDLDLTPKFDYDLEKAELLNCPSGKNSSKEDPNLLLIIFCCVFGVIVLVLGAIATKLTQKVAEYEKLQGVQAGP